MENAVEALKIAFAVMMFIMALSLSISSLSQANTAVTSIINFNDRETNYTYVEPSSGYTRTVGVETIVPTMYKAYQERFKIYFCKQDGTPLTIYYAIDDAGNIKKDEYGNEIEINYIDGSEVFGNAQEAVNHLNEILGDSSGVDEKHKNQIYYSEGFYNFLADKKFREELGEYYENDSENTPDINKTKTRVITYTLVN